MKCPIDDLGDSLVKTVKKWRKKNQEYFEDDAIEEILDDIVAIVKRAYYYKLCGEYQGDPNHILTIYEDILEPERLRGI